MGPWLQGSVTAAWTVARSARSPLAKRRKGGKALRGGTSQPWVEPCRLAPADQSGNVLRQRHSFCQCRSVRRELLQSLVVRLRALVWRAEDQPRRMPRGQWAV
jgi:hypothetical protein